MYHIVTWHSEGRHPFARSISIQITIDTYTELKTDKEQINIVWEQHDQLPELDKELLKLSGHLVENGNLRNEFDDFATMTITNLTEIS